MNLHTDSAANSTQPTDSSQKSQPKTIFLDDTEFENENLGKRTVDEEALIICEGGCE